MSPKQKARKSKKPAKLAEMVYEVRFLLKVSSEIIDVHDDVAAGDAIEAMVTGLIDDVIAECRDKPIVDVLFLDMTAMSVGQHGQDF